MVSNVFSIPITISALITKYSLLPIKRTESLNYFKCYALEVNKMPSEFPIR